MPFRLVAEPVAEAVHEEAEHGHGLTHRLIGWCCGGCGAVRPAAAATGDALLSTRES
jgi:hypothetical protein